MTTLSVEPAPLYVILREHQEYGPFDRQTLTEAVESGNLVVEDWVRHADRTASWTSVGTLLYGPPEPEPASVKVRRGVARLYRFACRSLEITSRLLDELSSRLAGRSGLVAFACITIATAIEFLPGRPLHISLPWILAGFTAGIVLLFRRKMLRGIIACLAASIVPLTAYWSIPVVNHYLDPDRRETALPPIGERYSSMPRRAPEVPRRPGRVISGVPALGLPQPALVKDSRNRGE